MNNATRPSARKVAVDLLARREHSSRELKRKLAARGFDDVDVDDALTQLADRGLQSDARFVEQYVRARATRGYGPQRIRVELAQRDCNADRASLEGYDWVSQCALVREKKFGRELPTSAPERARQARFLQYRGFTSDQIQCVLKGAHDVDQVLHMNGTL